MSIFCIEAKIRKKGGGCFVFWGANRQNQKKFFFSFWLFLVSLKYIQIHMHMLFLRTWPKKHLLLPTPMSRLKMYLPQDVMKSVYYSLYHSKLQYCITSWDGCPPTDQLPIFRLQKRALNVQSHTSHHLTHFSLKQIF